MSIGSSSGNVLKPQARVHYSGKCGEPLALALRASAGQPSRDEGRRRARIIGTGDRPAQNQ